jgi:hypothetical protein
VPEAAVVTCARCGAAVERAWTATQAHCSYCGSLLELPHAPAADGLPPARLASRTPRSPGGELAALRVWALGLGAIAVLVAGVAVNTYLRARAPRATVEPTASVPLVESTPHGDVTKLVAADLHTLDPASVIQQAAAAVKQRGSACELTYASFGVLRGGVIDASANNSVLLRWTCRRAGQTPAVAEADVVDDQWNTRLDRGYLTFEREDHGLRNSSPWREPSCPFSRAWAAAVASGVPADALANVFYEEWAFASGKTRPTVWRITVEAHDTYSRDIDCASCEVLERR